jgi:hypothetical protein
MPKEDLWKTLKTKHEIAKESHQNNYGVEKIMSRFGLSETEAKDHKKNSISYLSLDSDDQTSNERYKLTKIEEKYS